MRLNPNYGEAFANRAGAYLKQNDFARAAQDYDEAIRLKPNLDGVWSGRCWSRAILRRIAGGAGGLQQGPSIGARQRRDV
ncbi:tetratricopeptide repeat protein [Bradyrhizobium sp. 13971]